MLNNVKVNNQLESLREIKGCRNIYCTGCVQ